MPTTNELFRNWIAESNMGIKPIDRFGNEHLSSDQINERDKITNEIKFRPITPKSYDGSTITRLLGEPNDWRGVLTIKPRLRIVYNDNFSIYEKHYLQVISGSIYHFKLERLNTYMNFKVYKSGTVYILQPI